MGHTLYYYAGVDRSVPVLPWLLESDCSVLEDAALGTYGDLSCYEKLESGLGSAADNDRWVLQLDWVVLHKAVGDRAFLAAGLVAADTADTAAAAADRLATANTVAMLDAEPGTELKSE